MNTTKPTRAARFEGLVLVAIVVLVGCAAGAASFTHVHDWTMDNSPHGTPGWFGWANAVISELVPVAALLTVRRRKQTGGPIGYPMFLLIAFAGLSLAAQLGVAVGHVGPSGWLLSAVPAIAFMLLVKLVLAPGKTPPTEDTTTTAAATDTRGQTATQRDDTPAPAPAIEPALPVDHTPTVEPATVPTHLLPTARYAVVNHEQTTGAPITVEQLAARLSITPTIAGQLLHTINPPAALPARINGTPIGGAQ
jgi:hypothetical protein